MVQDINDDSPTPPEGVYVKGIFLEGAKWDHANQCLEEAPPRKLTDNMPPVITCSLLLKLNL